LATLNAKWALELDWRLVCGRYEVEELLYTGVLEPVKPRDPRHTLFLVMKYPNKILYKGGWGPEILYYDKEDDICRGQLGHVWALESRGKDIAIWLRDQMFNMPKGITKS